MINDFFKQKIETTLERLRAFEPEEGYYLAFSGGKDSVVCKALCDMAGVKYDAVYRVTSVDPPELVRFIKEVHPDVKREIPHYKDGEPITMWNLIPKNGALPTQIARYCCKHLKESGGDGRKVVTGVRWAESVRRKENQGLVTFTGKNKENAQMVASGNFLTNKQGGVVLVNDNEESRRMIESCYKRRKINVNPIIDWTDMEVWRFIHEYNISYCSLYDEGWSRIGCIGCPMATTRERLRQFARYPKYKQNYLKAIKTLMDIKERDGNPFYGWRTPEDMFHWWVRDGVLPGQMSLFDYEEEGDE